MTEQKREFVNVCLYDLLCPVRVGSKSKTEGEITLINIMVEAEIESKYEHEFEKHILGIIDARNTYRGPMQLSSKLIAYINSVNANTFTIIFRYPVFLDRYSTDSGSKHMAKYICERIIKRTSLITYKNFFKVEIPVMMKDLAAPGIPGNSPAVNNTINIEVEGFEPIFAEDIIEIVEDVFYNRPYDLQIEEGENLRLKLLDDIKNKIINRFSCDNCRVKMISQKLPYSFFSEVADNNDKKEKDKKYSEEYSII